MPVGKLGWRVFSLSRRIWAGIGLLVVLTAAIYWPAIGGGELLDDDLLLTQNKIVKSPDGLFQFWFTDKAADYWPLTNTTFWIEWRLWGNDLAGYHATNLALHILESVLIWFLLRKLKVPGAFWGALLFAVHPVNVESVAWIASRKNLVSMLFFLLSFWWYLNSEERFSAAESDGAQVKPAGMLARAMAFSSEEFAGGWYWLGFGAFVLAMLGKGSVAVLPALLLVVLWWKRPLEWRDARRTLPFFVVGASLAALNVWFQTHDTAEKVIRDVGLVDRTLTAGGIVWFYLYKAIWPFDLAFIYPSWSVDARNWLWWIPLCGALGATGVLFFAAKPWRPATNAFCPVWFAWLFFCLALFPVMGFCDVGFMKYALVADRYLHIPVLAIVALAAGAIGTCFAGLRPNMRWAAIVPAAVVVVVFSFVSWRQSGLYVDRFTLFQAANERNPESWMVRHTLGTCELERGRPRESLEHFVKALELHPTKDAWGAQIHVQYGHALRKLGRTSEAIEQYELAFAAAKPTSRIIESLGEAYREAGQTDKLLEFNARVTKLFPKNVALRGNYAAALIQAGRLPEAIRQYRLAVELEPKNADLLNNLAVAYYLFGDARQAVGCYRQALECRPDYAEAHYNLGGLLFQLNSLQDAIHHLETAVSLKPDYLKAQFLLAKCYRVAHQDEKAIVVGRRALAMARLQKDGRTAAEIEEWMRTGK